MLYKGLVASMIKCLSQLLEQDDLTADSRESLEVSIQCLESAYGVQVQDAPEDFNILHMYERRPTHSRKISSYQSLADAKAEAEMLKTEGNILMKNGKYHEAVANYTKAIELDNENAVYYCNRAAVYSKLGNHQQAIEDCHRALTIDPTYSKAHGRLGLAYSSLARYEEAKNSYQKAIDLEPENESLRNNLQIAEEKLSQQSTAPSGYERTSTPIPNMDLSSLLSNPALMNMARQMLSDPSMQNMMSTLMSGSVEQGGRMDALIEAGQQLAQQMQNANPELIESLRRQMGRNSGEPESSDKQ